MNLTSVFILLSTICYSLLFYQQSDGLNHFLFTVLLCILLFIRHPLLLKSKKTIVFTCIALATSFSVYWFNNSLAYKLSVISIMLISASAFSLESSMPAAFLHSIYSTVAAPIIHLYKRIFNRTETEYDHSKRLINRILLSLLPIMIVFVFIQIYRFGNPIFDNYISKINFDFISFEWLFFTFSGLWLMIVFFKHVQIESLHIFDVSKSNDLPNLTEENHQETYWSKVISISSELYTGVLLLGLLNVILLTLNSLDIFFVLIRGELPKDVNLSTYVHDGTNAIIISVVMASLIILFYFRGYLNFHKNNSWLKRLSYIWIVQNVILVTLTFNRNWLYIHNYGLTYKRIGVFVFLFLVIIGLLTIIFKIKDLKNNWFLFRQNAWSLYLVLAFYSLVDWDSIITNYNINYFQGKKKFEIDQRYLVELSHTNLTQLFEFYLVEQKKLTEKEHNSITNKHFGGKNYSRVDLYSGEIEDMIWSKYYNLLNEYSNHKWPSSCYTKSKTIEDVTELIKRNNLIAPVAATVDSSNADVISSFGVDLANTSQ